MWDGCSQFTWVHFHCISVHFQSTEHVYEVIQCHEHIAAECRPLLSAGNVLIVHAFMLAVLMVLTEWRAMSHTCTAVIMYKSLKALGYYCEHELIQANCISNIYTFGVY